MTSEGSPIALAWARRVRNQRASEGWGPPLVRLAGGALAVGLLVPLVSRVFLAWLEGPPELRDDAMQALLLRTGIVVVGWTAIEVYEALIRGADRDVLAIWPVRPASVVGFELARLARGRVWHLAAIGLLLGPIALVDPLLWAVGMLHTVGVGALALVASALAVLLAVEVSEHPRAAPWLDLVRGNNHRAQAAFLYAPGVVLLGCGGLIQAAAVGATRLHAGDPVGLGLLATPWVAAAACAWPIPALAAKSWFHAGSVIAEIDARYAMLEDRAEALRVYLEWAVRFFPASVGLWLLKDLRHGWRARRPWLSAAWLVGLAAIVAAWTRDPSGPGRTAALAAIGCWAIGAVGVLLERDEPAFLKVWLPSGGAARPLARAAAIGLWVQPAIAAGALAAGARQGLGALALVLVSGELAAALAAGASVLCARRGGLALYAPLAALGAGGIAAGVLR